MRAKKMFAIFASAALSALLLMPDLADARSRGAGGGFHGGGGFAAGGGGFRGGAVGFRGGAVGYRGGYRGGAVGYRGGYYRGGAVGYRGGWRGGPWAHRGWRRGWGWGAAAIGAGLIASSYYYPYEAYYPSEYYYEDDYPVVYGYGYRPSYGGWYGRCDPYRFGRYC